MNSTTLKAVAPTLVITAVTLGVSEFLFRREEKKFYKELSQAREKMHEADQWMSRVNDQLSGKPLKCSVDVISIVRDK